MSQPVCDLRKHAPVHKSLKTVAYYYHWTPIFGALGPQNAPERPAVCALDLKAGSQNCRHVFLYLSVPLE